MADKLYKMDYSSMNTFNDSRTSILNMLKKFYPNEYKNFESGNAGGMIIDAFAFVGEVLHFTQGQYFNQMFPQTVTDRRMAVNLAQWYGMKNIGATLPWVTIKATITVNAVNGVIQSNQIPKILPGAVVYAGNHSTPDFYLTSRIDFTKVPEDEWTKYYTNGVLTKVNITAYGFATTYVQNVINHTISTSDGSAFEKFYEITLNRYNIQQILNVTDQNGNKYYEVDHLAQDKAFEYIINDNDVHNNIPYLLFDNEAKYRFTTKQFVSSVDGKVYTKLIFGNISESEYQSKLFNANPNDMILPSTFMGVDEYSSAMNQINNRSYDPQNMMLIDSLGIGPSNGDILTIKYVSNENTNIKVNSGILTRIKNITWAWDDNAQQAHIISSLIINNDEPSAGGRDALTTEEIKQYTVAYGLNQKRAITQSDYAGIILSIPEYLGRPDKVYVSRGNVNSDPFKFEIYILSINGNSHYYDPTRNPAFINNMRLYLKKYKGLNDLVVLKAGKVWNCTINVDIVVKQDYKQESVSYNILTNAREYFSKDKWTFGQDININNFNDYIKSKVEGIFSIKTMVTKVDSSNKSYPMNILTQNPQLDTLKNIYFVPEDTIIEVRYLNDDIIINATSLA